MTRNTTELRRKQIYTWRDWFIGIYFLIMSASSFVTITGDRRLFTYSISAAIIGGIGFMAVILKLKRVEATMILTMGLLLAARAILLFPSSLTADNTNIIHYLMDIVSVRPLLDGMAAIFPLAVLAAYRERRGRISK